MSHVDKGTLHAYLDGALDTYPGTQARAIRAHLERCARCAAALEEARMLRDEVSGILAAPGLDVTAPPLEELRRRAASVAEGGGPPTGRVRLARMGWAASVVVALGAGWMLRGGQLPEPGALDRGRAAEAVSAGASEAPDTRTSGVAPGTAAPGAAVTGGMPSTAVEARGGVAGPDMAAAEGAPRGGGASQDTGGSVAALADAGGVAPGAGGADEVRSALALPASGEEATAPATAGAMKVAEQDALDRALTERLGEAPARTDRRSDAEAAAAAAPVVAQGDRLWVAEGVEPPPAGPGGRTGADSAGPAAAERASAPRASSVVVSRAEAASAGRLTAPPDGGRRTRATGAEPDEPGSLVVPGLEVISIVWREEGVTPAGVRVLQRLDSGGVLELIHLPEGIDAGAVAPVDEGVSELVVPRGPGWLILRAAVPVETLEALLGRLDAPPPI